MRVHEKPVHAEAVPQGFHITADEMCDVGIRVHENIDGDTRFTPPSLSAFLERVEKAKRNLHGAELNGKFALDEGDPELAERYHDEWTTINNVIETWRQRWRSCKKTHD